MNSHDCEPGSAADRGLLKQPFLFIRPKSRILLIDGFFDVFDLSSLLVHLIRVQRNIYADLSAGTMPVCIAIEIVSVPRVYVTAAVAGHSFQQLRSLLGDLISSCRLSCKKRRRESCWPWIMGNCRQAPRLSHRKKQEQRDNQTHAEQYNCDFPNHRCLPTKQVRRFFVSITSSLFAHPSSLCILIAQTLESCFSTEESRLKLSKSWLCQIPALPEFPRRTSPDRHGKSPRENVPSHNRRDKCKK